MIAVLRRLVFAVGILVCQLDVSLPADDPEQQPDQPKPASAESDPTGDPGAKTDAFQLSDRVGDILSPLFVAIKTAQVSRATIEVLSDSLMSGRIVDSKKSTYQIASKSPDHFTIYLKEPSQRTRIYNDGKSMVVALAPDAYFRLPDPLTNVAAVLGLPVPMGPYPEPILALTLAGVDPATSLVSGMKSIEIMDEKDFRGTIPAVHLRGVQADTVTWDLWLSKDDPPKPLRMLVDLTPMLLASQELQLPKGYSHQIRFDFLSWRVTGSVDDNLFSFAPAKDATEYKSLEHYHQVVASLAAQHPLLGKSMPKFNATLFSGKEINSVDLQDKVVVFDFWASWHEPCAEILPLIKLVSDEFADKGVMFLAINIREDEQQINAFLQKHKLNVPVAMDTDGSITESFLVETLPKTIVVGKNGIIESVHDGFPGEKEFKQRLRDELEVLSVGGRIATSRNSAEPSQEVLENQQDAETTREQETNE